MSIFLTPPFPRPPLLKRKTNNFFSFTEHQCGLPASRKSVPNQSEKFPRRFVHDWQECSAGGGLTLIQVLKQPFRRSQPPPSFFRRSLGGMIDFVKPVQRILRFIVEIKATCGDLLNYSYFSQPGIHYHRVPQLLRLSGLIDALARDTQASTQLKKVPLHARALSRSSRRCISFCLRSASLPNADCFTWCSSSERSFQAARLHGQPIL